MDPEQRRRHVLEAARAVFVARGYGGASMRAIAQKARVNEALLYRISPSKEQLFIDAVADPLDEAVNRTMELSLAPQPLREGGSDVRERSVLFILDLLKAMREIAPLLNAMLLADHETGEALYSQRIEPAIAAVGDVVRANLALWEHRNFDIEVVVRAVYGMCWFFAIDERYGTGVAKEPDDLAPELLGLLFEGLIARDDDASAECNLN
jgi:AcrR family transcriptional regulator